MQKCYIHILTCTHSSFSFKILFNSLFIRIKNIFNFSLYRHYIHSIGFQYIYKYILNEIILKHLIMHTVLILNNWTFLFTHTKIKSTNWELLRRCSLEPLDKHNFTKAYMRLRLILKYKYETAVNIKIATTYLLYNNDVKISSHIGAEILSVIFTYC